MLKVVFVVFVLFDVFQIIQGENLNCQFKDEEIVCQFINKAFSFGNFYTCEVTSLDNTNNKMVITGHNGVHQSNKNDADVKMIFIYNTNTKYMPEGLGTLFNLTNFVSVNSQLVEINAEMFEGMDNLEGLYLGNNKLSSVPLNTFMKLTKLKLLSLIRNQIEELPNGLFKNNVNLETIHLFSNKLKFIGSTLFDGLTKLNLVDLEYNVCIDKEYTGSTAITQLKEDIKVKCFNPNEIVKPRSKFLINREKVSNFLDQIMIGLMEADERLKTKATKELITN